jgi:hypothetical protein
MVPPFLAYYGVTTSNESMLWEAYNQVRFHQTPLFLTSNGADSQVTRLNCTAATSKTIRLAGSGSTLSWARMARIQDTGRRVRGGISDFHAR